MLSGMVAGFVANAAAIATHTAALIADKLETAAIVAMYAKDFCSKPWRKEQRPWCSRRSSLLSIQQKIPQLRLP